MPRQFPLWMALITVGIMTFAFWWAAEEYHHVVPATIAALGAGAITAGVLLGIDSRRK